MKYIIEIFIFIFVDLIFSIIFRNKRIAEMRALQEKAKYGSVLEITAVDYVKEINQAGEGVWVVLHLYKPGYFRFLSYLWPLHRIILFLFLLLIEIEDLILRYAK